MKENRPQYKVGRIFQKFLLTMFCKQLNGDLISVEFKVFYAHIFFILGFYHGGVLRAC